MAFEGLDDGQPFVKVARKMKVIEGMQPQINDMDPDAKKEMPDQLEDLPDDAERANENDEPNVDPGES